MMISKKECDEALCRLNLYAGSGVMLDNATRRKMIETLNQLIEEHFSNEPLKEDEIELDIPYWDNKDKWWCSIVLDSAREKLKIVYMDTDYYIWYEFEPNRFYRKKVV